MLSATISPKEIATENTGGTENTKRDLWFCVLGVLRGGLFFVLQLAYVRSASTGLSLEASLAGR